MKLLFICLAGINRSPTFAKWVNKNTKHKARSLGTHFSSDWKLLRWADKIFVMDLNQEVFLKRHFPDYMPKVEVVGVGDQYPPDSPELIELIEYWYDKRFGGKNGKGKRFRMP